MSKILVIEDEASIIALFRRMLTSAGHELITASDGENALCAAKSGTFDLVLSDLNLPGTPSGMDLLRAIRDLHPTTPIVVVSGYTASDVVDACKDMGITEFLPKPFEMTFVRNMVTRLTSS